MESNPHAVLNTQKLLEMSLPVQIITHLLTFIRAVPQRHKFIKSFIIETFKFYSAMWQLLISVFYLLCESQKNNLYKKF